MLLLMQCLRLRLLAMLQMRLDAGTFWFYQNNNINKEEFVRQMRTLVGDHMLKMAVYKLQQGFKDLILSNLKTLELLQWRILQVYIPNLMFLPLRRYLKTRPNHQNIVICCKEVKVEKRL